MLQSDIRGVHKQVRGGSARTPPPFLPVPRGRTARAFLMRFRCDQAMLEANIAKQLEEEAAAHEVPRLAMSRPAILLRPPSIAAN